MASLLRFYTLCLIGFARHTVIVAKTARQETAVEATATDVCTQGSHVGLLQLHARSLMHSAENQRHSPHMHHHDQQHQHHQHPQQMPQGKQSLQVLEKPGDKTTTLSCSDYVVELSDSHYDAGADVTVFNYLVSCQSGVKDISHWDLSKEAWNEEVQQCFTVDGGKSSSDSWVVGKDGKHTWPDSSDLIWAIKSDKGLSCPGSRTYTVALEGRMEKCSGTYAVKAGTGFAFCDITLPCCNEKPMTSPGAPDAGDKDDENTTTTTTAALAPPGESTTAAITTTQPPPPPPEQQRGSLSCGDYVVELSDSSYDAGADVTVFNYLVSCGNGVKDISHWDLAKEAWNEEVQQCFTIDTAGSSSDKWGVGKDGKHTWPDSNDLIWGIKSDQGLSCPGSKTYTVALEGQLETCEGEYAVKAGNGFAFCNIMLPCCHEQPTTTTTTTAPPAPTTVAPTQPPPEPTTVEPSTEAPATTVPEPEPTPAPTRAAPTPAPAPEPTLAPPTPSPEPEPETPAPTTAEPEAPGTTVPPPGPKPKPGPNKPEPVPSTAAPEPEPETPAPEPKPKPGPNKPEPVPSTAAPETPGPKPKPGPNKPEPAPPTPVPEPEPETPTPAPEPKPKPGPGPNKPEPEPKPKPGPNKPEPVPPTPEPEAPPETPAPEPKPKPGPGPNKPEPGPNKPKPGPNKPKPGPTTPEPEAPDPQSGTFPTTMTTTQCEGKDCTFWGDPHVHSFDNMDFSYMQEGDMWLVKSPHVWIQGRFNLGNNSHSFLKVLAVGGPFLQGNTLTIGSGEGEVLWNDGQILDRMNTHFETSWKIPSSKVRQRVRAAIRDSEANIMHPGVTHRGFDVSLPRGIKLVVDRYQQWLGVSIQQKHAFKEGQDGICGNYNDNTEDDALPALTSRMRLEVSDKDTLFHVKFAEWAAKHLRD